MGVRWVKTGGAARRRTSLSSKNLRGGGFKRPPQQGAVNTFPSAKNKKEKQESLFANKTSFL